MRRLLITIAALSLALGGASRAAQAVGSRAPGQATITVHTNGSTGAFTAQTPVCASGRTSDLMRYVTAGTDTRADIILAKQFTCDDGTGSFLVLLRVHVTFGPFTDSFTWRVLGGSGAYVNLRGIGTGSGVPQTDGSLLDRFVGPLVLTGAPASSSASVAVHRGQPIDLALAIDRQGAGAPFADGIANAVRMAVDAQPGIRGFPVRVTEVSAPCGDAGADVAAAQSIVANLQYAAVLGQVCSSGFDQSLPIYEAAHVVTISGSASASTLPPFGSTVFDRTIVADPGSDTWYAAVSQLPSDLAWRALYALRFGTAPTDFADLYFDAAGLLIQNIANVATIDRGSLVIDRAALAHAVRTTSRYPGVTCTITLDPSTGNRVNDLGGC